MWPCWSPARRGSYRCPEAVTPGLTEVVLLTLLLSHKQRVCRAGVCESLLGSLTFKSAETDCHGTRAVSICRPGGSSCAPQRPQVWPWTQDCCTDSCFPTGSAAGGQPKGGFCLGGEEVLPVLHGAVVFTLAPGRVGSCWALSCVALDEQLCPLEPGWSQGCRSLHGWVHLSLRGWQVGGWDRATARHQYGLLLRPLITSCEGGQLPLISLGHSPLRPLPHQDSG